MIGEVGFANKDHRSKPCLYARVRELVKTEDGTEDKTLEEEGVGQGEGNEWKGMNGVEPYQNSWPSY